MLDMHGNVALITESMCAELSVPCCDMPCTNV